MNQQIQMRTLKVYLIPTKEQEELFNKSAGVSRWDYNYALALNIQCYEKLNKYTNEQEIRKSITQLKKESEYQWLKEVNNNVYKQSVKDQDKAFKSFFKGRTKYPKFKRKSKTTDSFYIDNSKGFKFNLEGTKVQIPSIGEVKISRSFHKFKLQNTNNIKLYNTHIVKDQLNRWYITITFEVTQKQSKLTDEILGIDVGIKSTAILSNGYTYSNINKTTKVKKIQKKKERLQRKLSRKYQLNKQGNKFIKTNNIKKLEQTIRKIDFKLHNIRMNHLHHISRSIAKTKPRAIVMEKLSIKNLMKNKHLSKAMQDQALYELKRQVKYKSEFAGTQFIEAPSNYPSTKMCSTCGSIQKISLGQRTYKCTNCGETIDRDHNAALNLSNYGKKQLQMNT